MNKNKYMAILAGLILLFVAVAAFAKNKTKTAVHHDTRKAMHDAHYIADNCSVIFHKALGGHTATFGDRTEDYLENNAFWEDCIQPDLDDGKHAKIHITALTADTAPDIRETTRAVRAALSFTEEFNDYVEDAQEYTGVYETPMTFTRLDVADNISLRKPLMREVNRTNRYFKSGSKEPKVHISVKTEKAKRTEDIGAIVINTEGKTISAVSKEM